MDTVDAHFTDEWFGNLARVLDGRKPDYLVVQHMEPDHAANVANFMKSISGDDCRSKCKKTFCHDQKISFELDLEAGSWLWKMAAPLSLEATR